MSGKELEFQRIARQAREFREKEEQRIAAEKQIEAKRVEAEKKAEREKIAQAHEESLEMQQGQLDAEGHNDDLILSSSSSFDSKSSKPRTGTVKLRAEWLRKLEKDAAARRLVEDEFNALLATRRKQNPDEEMAISEAAVKAVIWKSSSSEDNSLHSVIEESKELPIAERIRCAGSNPQQSMDQEFSNVNSSTIREEENQNVHDTSTKKKSIIQGNAIDGNLRRHSTENEIDFPADSDITESETATECLHIQLQSEPKNSTENQYPKQKSEYPVPDYGVEVDPKTQAMLAEDDSILNRNNRDYDVISSKNSNMNQDRDKKRLVLQNSLPVARNSFRQAKRYRRGNLDDDVHSNSEAVLKEASFEIPVEIAESRLMLSPDTTSLNMITSIPPSRLGGRITGKLEGRSTFGNNSNKAFGSGSLEYKSSRYSRLTLGMIRGCQPHHPLISIGGQILRHGSSVGVTFYHNAKFLHQMMLEHSLWSLSFRHRVPDSNWCFSSQLSRRQDLILSLENGSKLFGLISWNLNKPKQLHARIDIRPRITEYRNVHFYCQWKTFPGPSFWNFGVSLVQNLHSQIATIGLGWRLLSTKGLEWIISWSRGNATVRIPIVVSKGLAANATIGHSLYLSVVSYLIQDYIAEAWGWNEEYNDVSENGVDDRLLTIRAQNLTKARRDAAIQKQLMLRQAQRKVRDEKEKNGLIIQKAIYTIEDGEEWDVTIPLQFWVVRSTLILTSRPKSELLGFYDIAASLKNSRSLSLATEMNTGQTSRFGCHFFSWSYIWRDLLDWPQKDGLLPASSVSSPTLSVWYEFNGQSHQITINDREELKLPTR